MTSAAPLHAALPDACAACCILIPRGAESAIRQTWEERPVCEPCFEALLQSGVSQSVGSPDATGTP